MEQELKMEKLYESVLSLLPSCCGKKMEIKSSPGKFIEVFCSVCEDVAYIKNIVSH